MVPGTLVQFLFLKDTRGMLSQAPECELELSLDVEGGKDLGAGGNGALPGPACVILPGGWPPTGEEDIVLVVIHYRPWPPAGPYTQSFVKASCLGRAWWDEGGSEAQRHLGPANVQTLQQGHPQSPGCTGHLPSTDLLVCTHNPQSPGILHTHSSPKNRVGWKFIWFFH